LTRAARTGTLTAMRKRWLAVVLWATAAACGSSLSNNGGGDGGGGGGDGGVSMTNDAVTFEMTPFTVTAGSEVFKYQDFANPFQGADAEVTAFESHMTTGSHHLLVFYENITADGPLTDGNGLMFGPTPFGAQQPDLTLTYPTGVASVVPASKGIRVQAHYLNATTHDINAVVKVIFHIAKPGTITQHAGVFFYVNPQIFVPRMTTRTISTTCSFPIAANLIYATGHMHQHGTNFVATTNGTTFYQTDNWAQAPTASLTPPIQATVNQQIDFACTFVNMTNSDLIFGESAETNEMCILSGQYYPVPAGADPLIGCQ
jgi:hypothetical protein